VGHAAALHCNKMKSAAVSYWSWTWAFNHDTQLCTCLQTIPTLTLPQRKDLLGLCRSQTPPVHGSHQRRSLKTSDTTISVPLVPQRDPNNLSYTSFSFLDYLLDIRRLYTDHLLAAILSSALRVSPGVSKDDFNSSLTQSIYKEISAGITICPSATFDFRCIFDDKLSSRCIPFTNRLKPDPSVASDTYSMFVSVRNRLSGSIILPSLGKKTVGRVVAENFWSMYHASGCEFMHEGEVRHDVTTSDCARLYLETGCEVFGPVEMRYAWTYNQLDPRVYYARGGDVISSSQYVQTIANILVDMLPETHRKDRFMPPRVPLRATDVEIIYDYSSFTSQLEAAVPFLTSLAHFFRGTVVQLVDIRGGLINTDLGDLFDRYNSECNLYANFDASRVLDQQYGTTIMQHTCGMLGVEGNIFLDTLLHGIHLRFIAGVDRSRCVGDDARYHCVTDAGYLSQDEKSYQHWMLSGCGELNESKMGVFEREVDNVLQAYRYVKRPLYRDQDIMIEGLLLTLPSIIGFGPLDDLHTVHPSSTHPARKVYSQILRMIQEFYVHSLRYDDTSIVWKSILKHFMFLRRHCLRVDPDGKHSMFQSSSYLTHYRFPRPDTWGVLSIDDWIQDDIGFDEEVKFPSMWAREIEGTCDGRAGSEMIRSGSKARSILEKLGYLVREDFYDVVSIASVGVDVFHKYLLGDYRSFSKFTIRKDVPSWWTFVPKAL
jgi:hypothetical protein